MQELVETPHIHTSQVASAGQQATTIAQAYDVEPSAAAVLDEMDIDAEIKAALRAPIEISTACEAATVAVSTLQHTAAFDLKLSWRIGGGNQQIAIGLAAELGSAFGLTRPPPRSLSMATTPSSAPQSAMSDSITSSLPCRCHS